MNAAPAFVLHLGAFKTATTSLQRLLVHHQPRLAADGWHVYAGVYDRSYDLIGLLHEHLRGAGDRQAALAALAAIMGPAEAPRRFVSEEMLLGDLHAGPGLFGAQLEGFCELLQEMSLPPARVVFVTRRLDRLLESYYLHNYAVGFTALDFDAFYAALDLPRLSWCAVLERLAASPAVAEVTVLPFELCQRDPALFTRRFFAACGLGGTPLAEARLPRENAGLDAAGYRVLRAIHAEAWPVEDRVHLVKRIAPALRELAGGDKPDLMGPRRAALLSAWRADSRALLARWMPDAPADIVAHYLGEDA